MTANVKLLGRMRVSIGNDVWEPPSHLTVALFAHVAYQSDWVDRSALAALFWPEADQSGALTNLRSLLARCKREPFARGFDVEATRVRWNASCDVHTFQKAFEAEQWEEATATYGGTLLERMAFDASPAFDAWLHMTREHLKDAYQTAALHRAHALLEAGRIHDAIAVTRDLLRDDPLNESAAQFAMRLHAWAGRPDAAVRVYRTLADRLHAELELEPSSATAVLLDEIQHGVRGPLAPGSTTDAVDETDQKEGGDFDSKPPERTLSPVPGRIREEPDATVATPLPPALTSFFGREHEVATIAELFGRADCKLVTVTGTGGVGKTRLATVAAERIRARYPDGVAFVPLESVATASDAPSAIATALGLELRSRERPDSQLLHFVGNRRMLVVLDNFEHLLDATDLVRRLLMSCTNLDILITSRERLGLPSERLVDLHGLPYPGDPRHLADADRFPAVALMISRIHQVRPDLPVDASTLAPVVKICSLVQGLPLAMELAAVWAKSLPLDEVANEIGRNLDFLSSGPAASTSRHRSVRAAFEHSWELLTPVEREAMRKLSVFRGGFRRSAAAFVADASIAVLAALVDKSLLRVSLMGRYDCHPLIAAFALEKLRGDPGMNRDARRRHAEQLVWRFEQAQPHVDPERRRIWLERIDPERENLSAAMEFALEERDAELGARLVLLLRRLPLPWDFITSRRHLVDALVSLNGDVRPAVAAESLAFAGVVAHAEDDIDAAMKLYEGAIDLANSAVQPNIVLNLHTNVANIERDRGRFDVAREHYARALELMERTGGTRSAANMLNNLATLDRHEGDLKRARLRHQQSLDIGRSVQVPTTLCQALNGLAYVERDLGCHDAAAALLEESLAIARSHQIQPSIIACTEALGRLARRSGDVDAALGFHREGLALVRDTHVFRLLDRSLDAAADLLATAGSAVDAVRIWHAAQSVRESRGATHPHDPPPDRPKLKDDARNVLGAAAYDRAATAGAMLDRNAAIEAALTALDELRSGPVEPHQR